jgi:hypothetical protein
LIWCRAFLITGHVSRAPQEAYLLSYDFHGRMLFAIAFVLAHLQPAFNIDAVALAEMLRANLP